MGEASGPEILEVEANGVRFRALTRVLGAAPGGAAA